MSLIETKFPISAPHIPADRVDYEAISREWAKGRTLEAHIARAERSYAVRKANEVVRVKVEQVGEGKAWNDSVEAEIAVIAKMGVR